MENKNEFELIKAALISYNFSLVSNLLEDANLKKAFKILQEIDDYKIKQDVGQEEVRNILSNVSKETLFPLLIEIFYSLDKFRGGDSFIYNTAIYLLNKNGWEPPNVQDKIVFLVKLEAWNKLVELGGVACPKLYDHYRWEELSKIKDVSIPFIIRKYCYYFEHNNAKELLLKIGKEAIPEIVKELKSPTFNQYYRDDLRQLLFKLGWEPFELVDKIERIIELHEYNKLAQLGKPGLQIIVDFWIRSGNPYLLKVLQELKWNPPTPELQIMYYEATNQLQMLVPYGELAVPVLIAKNRWDLLIEIGEKAIPYLKMELSKIEIKLGMLSSTHDHYVKIGNTLMQLSWSPESIDEKLKFYFELKAWQELKMLGEPALKILLENKRWKELGEIREISISFLVNILLKETISTSWDTFNPQNSKAFNCLTQISWIPITTEEKLAYYLYKPDWEEVVKLGDISISYLVQIFHDNIRFKGKEAGQVLLRYGERSIPFLSDLLNQIAKEGIDHAGFMTTDRDSKISERELNTIALLFSIGSESAILCVIKALPYLLRESNRLYVAKKIFEVLPNFQSMAINKSLEKTKKILIDQLANGKVNGKVLEALNSDVETIANTYIDLIKKLERPTNYDTILDFFVRNKVYSAVYPLLEIVNVPKSGSEQFYKDIIYTVGKIGNVRAIPLLKQLLYTNWNVIGRTGQIEKTINSKWIESQLQWAINELEKGIQPELKNATITSTTVNKTITEKSDKHQISLNEAILKNNLGEKQKNKWWRFW